MNSLYDRLGDGQNDDWDELNVDGPVSNECEVVIADTIVDAGGGRRVQESEFECLSCPAQLRIHQSSEPASRQSP